MALVHAAPETVPFDEVAAVLAEAAMRVTGGPPAMIIADGAQLAVALSRAGFRVVRECAVDGQLSL